MEAGRERYRDDYRLPPLSLGLSSVRLIVNQLEAEYERAANKIQETSTEIVKYDPKVDEGYDYDDSLLDHSRGRVWNRIAMNLGIALCKCVPSVSFCNFSVLAVTTGLIAPRMISYLVLYPFCRLVFGTLYPAYASYKAVRTKNLKEYVKWMMYWIVFALFTCTETFTDVFLSWFPFYYEVKIVLVLWLLSPATKGSSILYRKFVHPALCRREQEIDEYIAKAKDQGYHTVLNLGTKGVNYATTVIMQTAIKGGGGLVQQLRKSYSLSDLTECEPHDERGADEADDVLGEPRLVRRSVKSGPRRSASESNSRSPMYFPEVDVDVKTNRSRTDEPDFSHVKSSEDISSGYSSADNSASLTRAGSIGARARSRTARTAVTAIKRPQAAEDDEVIIEEPHDDDTFEYANMPPLVNIPSPLFLSHSDPPFLYQYIGDQIKVIQVLGDLPLSLNSHKKATNADQWDQIDAAPKTTTQRESIEKENIKLDNVQKETKQDVEIIEATVLQTENIKRDKSISSTAEIIVPEDSMIEAQKELQTKNDEKTLEDVFLMAEAQKQETLENKTTLEGIKTFEIVNETNKDCSAENKLQEKHVNKVEESIETTSLETSMNENDSAESDDEASFGTPDNSPKSKRKANKGKYGKAKAPPPPPKIEQLDVANEHNDKILESAISTTSQESLTDIVNRLPDNALKDSTMSKGLQVVNPIAEKKRRHKAKSPARVPKAQNSSIGKLLQLPSKLAFWQKSDDKGKTDAISTSADHSRRSSTVERPADEFQSCSELNKIISKVDYIEDDQISFQDAADYDSESISQDIIEKSDALQKLIEAKLESHPEYKFVPLHEEIPTTSKSTDV